MDTATTQETTTTIRAQVILQEELGMPEDPAVKAQVFAQVSVPIPPTLPADFADWDRVMVSVARHMACRSERKALAC